jgi:hypothetical protein
MHSILDPFSQDLLKIRTEKAIGHCSEAQFTLTLAGANLMQKEFERTPTSLAGNRLGDNECVWKIRPGHEGP